MTRDPVAFIKGRLFDGQALQDGAVARFAGGRFAGLAARPEPGDGVVDLGGDILSPGYVDLQVNGGDGVMLGDAPSVATLRRIAGAHRRLGVARLLPTLITADRQTTAAAIRAAMDGVRAGVPGLAGLHLEGPHLSLARKGAHDEALIRPMQQADLTALLEAARALPVLKVTIAPENVTPEQVQALSGAGVLVSLGHSDADFDTSMRYFEAGARCATHLFNAMSPLASRAPGLVGAALAQGAASCGVIADGIHVHPQSLRAAWAAKAGPGRIFMVSDAMAVAGSTLDRFTLDGREIIRRDGRLTLADGTLAGADLDLTQALRVMTAQVGVPLADALRAATTTPAALIGLDWRLRSGFALADMIRIRADLTGVAQALPGGDATEGGVS